MRSDMVSKMNVTGRAWVFLWMLLVSWAMSPLLARGEDPAPEDVGAYVTVGTANERTTLDRDTRILTSEVDITLTNTSNKPIAAPFHAAFEILGVPNESVQMPGALGGPGTGPYGKYYDDLSPLLGGGLLSPGEAVTFHAVFTRAATVIFQYDVVPYGILETPPVNHPPTLQPVEDKSVHEGQVLGFQIVGNDLDNDSLTYGANNLPAGAGVSPESGMFSWTPGFDQSGSYQVTLYVTDGKASAQQSISIQVIDVNRPPTLGTLEIPPGRVDQPYNVKIAAADPDGDPLTFALVQGPSDMEIGAQTGELTWRPGLTHIGDHALTVEVNDGHGGSDRRPYVLSVPDTIPPSVFLNVPSTALPGKPFTATVQAQDNLAVASLEVDDSKQDFAPPLQKAVMLQREMTALSDLGTMVIRVRAWDPSGNMTEAFAHVSVAAAFDTAPPQVDLAAPEKAAPGQTILLSSRVSDNVGVATVTFFADGSLVGTLPGGTPVIPYQVPADAVIGSEIIFRAVAEDFSGNTAGDDAATLIVAVDQADTTPPEPSVQTPGEVREDETLPVETEVPNEPCLSRIEVYVNHTLAATYTVPEGRDFDVPLPPGVEGGMDVLVEVVVTDCAGNERREIRTVHVTAPGKGVVAGEVYDDVTGLPLSGANVVLVTDQGETAAATTSDDGGQYSLVAAAGPSRLIITKEGFTPVERTRLLIFDSEGTEALDARLTPLDAPLPAVSAILGGTLHNPFSIVRAGLVPVLRDAGMDPASIPVAEIELEIPGGALELDRSFSLTQVSPQGLQGLLPGGWSPVGVVDLAPHGIALQGSASLSLPNPLGLDGSAGIVFAAWDETIHAWRVAGEAAIDPDGRRMSAQVDATGQYAFVLPDAAPLSPPDAVLGEPLGGATIGMLPEQAEMVITPEPRILFYQPGVHSDVGVRVSSGSSPLSSGTPVLVRAHEQYRFYSGDEVLAEPYVQDIVLYAMNRHLLTAGFPITPGLAFEALSLEQGVINLDAFAPSDPARTINVVGSPGGSVTASTGEALTLPAGAVSGMTPVVLSGLSGDALGMELPQSLAYVGGISVSFAGARLMLPASLSVPVPQGFVDEEQLLLVRLLEAEGTTRMALVAVGEVQGDMVVSRTALTGQVSLEGILSGCRYFFVKTEAGFAHGDVLGTDGQPLAGALITSDTHPLGTLSRSGGRYVAAVAPGPYVLTALDTVKKDKGTASGNMPQSGDLQRLDISLEQEPPTVASVSPPDGAQNVALAAAVKIQFSEPLDPGTVTAENVLLNGPGGPVAGTVTLTSNDRLVTFRPAEPLAPNTAYTITASQEIRDLAGYALQAAFVSTFTSLDTEPPPPPPAGSINAAIPADDGRTTVTATQGTAGPHDTVTIVNKTRNASTPVLVEPDGSFSVRIDAGMLDQVVISIKDLAGNETVVPVGPFRNPDGSTVVGPEGGLLDAQNGVVLDVPPGAFPNGAIVKLSALTQGDIGLNPGPDFPFVAAFDVECSEPPRIYMNASAPVPEGTAPGKRGIVARLVEIYSGPVLSIVDTATVLDGRLATASPPCPGILARVGRYAMFLNDHQKMAMGEALLSMVAPADRSSVMSALIEGMVGQYSAWFPAYAHVFKAVAYAVAGPASTEYAGEAYSELHRQICLPVPPDAPLKVVVRDADTGDVIDVFDVDPIDPGSHADITYRDPEDKRPPEILGVEPSHKVLGASNREIAVRFSEPIDHESARSILFVSQRDVQRTYEGVFELQDNNRLLRMASKVPLPLGENFRVVLSGIKDLAGNSYAGPPLFVYTFEPALIFPTGDQRLDRNTIANDLGLNLQNIPQDLWFIDVDFITRSPEKSPDGKWHTDLFAIQAGEGGAGQYRLFNINADDPTSPVVTGAFATDHRFLQRRVRILDDVHIVPRPDALAQPQFWKMRELHYREDDPSNRICGTPGSPEIAAWRAVNCEDPADCGVLVGGCGDLAVTVVDNTQYGYLWSYDVTERNNVRWASSRMLNDNGTGYGFPRYYEAPAGLGTLFGLEVLTGLDIAHGEMVNENTVGAYVANYGIGVELVDLGLNLPMINPDERRPGSPDAWAKVEALKINAQRYYRDMAFVRGKAVAVAGQLGAGAGVRTLEIFRPDLAGEPLCTVPLLNSPNRLAAVADFPVSGTDEGGPVLKDLVFITSQEGGILVAEIPRALGAGGCAQLQANTNTIPTPQGVSTKGIQVDRAGTTAYVAASGVEPGVPGDHILVVDVSQPYNASRDMDQDGWDDRILGRVKVALPDYQGPVYVHGFRLDVERGLIYGGLYAGGIQGLAVIKVRECPDLGVDFKAKPTPASLDPKLERSALEKVIKAGLSQCDSEGITIIEQGSGACIWKDTCGLDYQPFVSDHDFEVFFPRGTAQETIDCVIEGLYRQVVNEASDPVPVEVQGYLVTFENISFFPMVREEFEEAMLNILPPVTEQGDATGDMGLGRQQLLLKWLVEGVYVDVPGEDLTGSSFCEILEKLRRPMDMDGDGTEDEPSQIPRLEGYEWAKFQESEVYASGALIRIHGASEPGTTFHQIYKKDLHKMAKAAIRAVLARLVASETGNRLAVDLNCSRPTCIDATADDDPYLWPLRTCDSFAHHIASVAARMLRDHPEIPLFTVDEVQDKIYRFYRVKTGMEQVSTDEDANAFIAMAMNFIQDIQAPTGNVYFLTRPGDPRQDQRRDNLSAVEERIKDLKVPGRKQIIPRFYNDGAGDTGDVKVRMYIGGLQKGEESISLAAGETVHLDTKKEPRPQPQDSPDTKRKNVPVFSLEADPDDGGQSGWVSFLVDLPEKKVLEPQRENNWTTAFFYVLDRESPSVPARPEEPELSDILGEPTDDLLEPDPVCECVVPKARTLLTVDGSDTKILYIGGDVAVADLVVENPSDQVMKEVKVYRLDEGGLELIKEIAEIPIGGSVSTKVIYFPGSQPGTEEKLIFVEYTDEDGKVHGFGSNLLYLQTRCPIALVALDPDPNPEVSEVMAGGTFCRHYRVMDRSKGQPVPNAAVQVRFFAGNAIITTREFKTNEDGFVLTEALGQETRMGMCVPWGLWGNLVEMPPEGSHSIQGDMNIDELWLMAEMPNACRAEPMTFGVELKPLQFEESFRAGLSSSIEGSLLGASGSLRDGASIDLVLRGNKQGDQQAFNQISIRRSESAAKALGFKAELGFKVKSSLASLEVKGPSFKEELPLATTTGDLYEFPLAAVGLNEADQIKTAGLYLSTVMEAGSPCLATTMLMKKLLGTVEDFSASKASESWGVSFAPSLEFTLFSVKGAAGLGDVAQLSLDLSAAAGSSLYSGIGTEDFLKEPKKIRTCEFTGELYAKAGLDLGLESALTAHPNEDIKVKQTLIKERDRLVELGGEWSRGMKLALTLDKTKGLLPVRLEVTFKGRKDFGFKVQGETLASLGEGEDFNITYSVTELKDIMPVIRSMVEYGALLDSQRKAGIGLDPTLAVAVGPQRIFERMIESIFLLKDNAEYVVMKEEGTSKEGSSGLGINLLVVGFGAEDVLKGDHVVSFVIEKGAFKGGLKYKLEDYAVEDFKEPSRGELESLLDQIESTVAERTQSAFEAVERNDQEMRIRTQNSSDLRLRNQEDYETVLGPLSFNFEGRPGPFDPYHYAPGDIVGSADKPRYGIGGFHEFFPLRHSLTDLATLTIDYHEEEIVGIEEGSLAIYRWDYDKRDWQFVGGAIDAVNNTVTTEIDRLGAYTIGPSMPAGTVEWEDPVVQQLGETIRLTLVTRPLLMNNGNPIPDGTVFHVISALPYAYSGEGLIPFGDILSDDARPETAGNQLVVENGKITVRVEYPGGVSLGARIVVFSDVGTALGDRTVSLATP